MGKASVNFTVGIFVLLGLGLLVGGIVWLGASKYAGSAKTFVTYFDESVQGLQVDSVVKYRGVAVGRVTHIRVAPDHRLIEVVMNAEIDPELAKEVVAVLRMVGITGISFIELDRKEPGVPNQSPKLTFAAEHPVIPSRPSEISQMLTLFERVGRQLNQVDFKGIGKSLNQAINSFKELAKGDALKRLLEEGAQTLAGAKKAMANINHILESGKIEGTLDQTSSAVQALKSASAQVEILAQKLQGEIVAMKLPEQSAKAGQALDGARGMMSGLSARTLEITESLKSTLENLRRAASSLSRLADRLESSPSDVLFSKPPVERKLPNAQNAQP